ncbi:hypothetical protein LCGC14_2192930 [marine sediment metagenome]|uniref:Uncharacterized protein n=1 Tax=marine sediment metagenome TaxID=412755 RepID=A0A0F9E639_9ZZZZ
MGKFDFVKINNQVGKVFLPKDIMKVWSKTIDKILKRNFLMLKQVGIDPELAWGLAVNDIYNSIVANLPDFPLL